MTVLAHETDLRAAELAERNLAANLSALRQTQPDIARLAEDAACPGPFLFARDGSLTARPDGLWAGGCSLPLRAARAMLESLQNTSACFLEPTHAAQLAVVLERMDPPQALIAVVTDPSNLRFILACHDFSADLAAGRLWFAAGENWPDMLAGLLREREGVPTPSAFIRLPILSEEVAETLIRIARELLAGESARRAERINTLKSQWELARSAPRTAASSTICTVFPGHFRLWDDAGWLLSKTLCATDERFVPFDPDRSTSASPLAFAAAATACDAVLTAGVFRCDVPDVVPAALPWITFATTPRLAAPVPAAGRDWLILTDPAQRPQALRLGWPAERILIAGWPETGGVLPAAPSNRGGLVLIADTSDVQAPPEPLEFSSHQLLWDLVRDEIAVDPFILGNDVSVYLDDRRQRLEIGDELDRALFIDRLIVPAFQQAIVRLLLRHGASLEIHGRGWPADLAAHVRGPVDDRARFLEIVAGAGALLHAWPMHGPHPIDAWRRPVVRAFGGNTQALLRQVADTTTPSPAAPALSASMLLEKLSTHQASHR